MTLQSSPSVRELQGTATRVDHFVQPTHALCPKILVSFHMLKNILTCGCQRISVCKSKGKHSHTLYPYTHMYNSFVRPATHGPFFRSATIIMAVLIDELAAKLCLLLFSLISRDYQAKSEFSRDSQKKIAGAIKSLKSHVPP